MTSPSNSSFKCPKWLQYACCLLPLGFLGMLSLGAACGIQISPYVALPVVALNAKVISAALGLVPVPLFAFGRPISELPSCTETASSKSTKVT